MSEQEATADEQLVEEIVEEQEADIEELDTAPEEKEEVTEPARLLLRRVLAIFLLLALLFGVALLA